MTVEDFPNGDPLEGVSVVPSLIGSGQLSADTNLVTDENGRVEFTFQPGTAADTDTISALVDGNVTISTQVAVSPLPPDPAHTSLGAQLTPPMAARQRH